jgi:hypothetical protein
MNEESRKEINRCSVTCVTNNLSSQQSISWFQFLGLVVGYFIRCAELIIWCVSHLVIQLFRCKLVGLVALDLAYFLFNGV